MHKGARALRHAPLFFALRPHARKRRKQKSVSSALPAQETRLAAPTPARRRALRPHQPSGGSEGPRGPGRSIVAVGAGRALRSFRSPPSGRFATFGGKCPQGTRFPPVPSELYSESGDMRGGFGSLASARPPYAGRRPASRRLCRRRSRRPAHPRRKRSPTASFCDACQLYLAFAIL